MNLVTVGGLMIEKYFFLLVLVVSLSAFSLLYVLGRERDRLAVHRQLSENRQAVRFQALRAHINVVKYQQDGEIKYWNRIIDYTEERCQENLEATWFDYLEDFHKFHKHKPAFIDDHRLNRDQLQQVRTVLRIDRDGYKSAFEAVLEDENIRYCTKELAKAYDPELHFCNDVLYATLELKVWRCLPSAGKSHFRSENEMITRLENALGEDQDQELPESKPYWVYS